nr:transposase [Xanthomonas cannabis]
MLPRRWAVERSFGWVNRFRHLARYYERLPETLAGLHFVVFSILMFGYAASLFLKFITRFRNRLAELKGRPNETIKIPTTRSN